MVDAKRIKILIATGTRPELIKVSVLLRLVAEDNEFSLIFVHSGQHYDDNMFEIFLKELELPPINYNLGIGSMPNVLQTANIMVKMHEIIVKEKPDVILAQGDTNTVAAASLSAFKSNIPFAHLEAGIRSFDLRMPEEINRMLVAVASSFNFAPTSLAACNLIQQGVDPAKIFIVGNSIVDAVLSNVKIAEKKSTIIKKHGLFEKYVLITTHRPANVDEENNLRNIIDAIVEISQKIQIIFPVHPRTMNNIKKFGIFEKLSTCKNIKLLEPLGYLDFLLLMQNCYFIITDSGGLQEEAIILKKPCLTLRENTERPETVELGANILVGCDKALIIKHAINLIEKKEEYSKMIISCNPYGNGDTSQKVLNIIKYYLPYFSLSTSNFIEHNIPRTKLIDLSNSFVNFTVKQYERQFNSIIFQIFNEKGDFIFPEPELALKKEWKLIIRTI